MRANGFALPLVLLTVVLGMVVIGGLVYFQQAQSINRQDVANPRQKTSTPASLQRSFTDRPDDAKAPQIHLMYVLPKDGIDESLDTNGKIAGSVAAFQKWLEGQTGDKLLRIDTFNRLLDITFFQLKRTDSEMKSFDEYLLDEIANELVAAGFVQQHKLYAVYYGGGNDHTCAGGNTPPNTPIRIAGEYLKAKAQGCDLAPFTGEEVDPGLWNLGMLHEILHAMDFVASCAPSHTLAGHVSDDPSDLMYAGPLDWNPSILDVGNNDYFNHGKAGCLDLAKSEYLTY